MEALQNTYLPLQDASFDFFPLGVIGFKGTLEVREKIARLTDAIVEKVILLITCNRIEIYFFEETEILSFFEKEGIDPSQFYSYFGLAAFIHLCKVTAGIDSTIFGETQIQHQMKSAYLEAAKKKELSKCQHFAFQKGLRVGKMARKWIESVSPTFNQILWQIAKKEGGHKSKVLFVGFSQTNRSFAHFLQKQGGFLLAMATTNPDRVDMPGVALFSRSILMRWQEFDWIIFATKTDEYLIQGTGNGQLIFDLSLPRNVDPRVEGVSLWNMERVNQLIEKEKALSPDVRKKCEQFVVTSASRYAFLYHKKNRVYTEII